MTISNTDIYVFGVEAINESTQAIYWKNNERVNVTDGTKRAAITDMAIYGADIYVAGYEDQNNASSGGGFTKAKIWKNGVATILNEGNFVAEVTGIFITTN